MRPASSSSALKGADVVFTEVSFEVPYAGPFCGFQVSSRFHGRILECLKERMQGDAGVAVRVLWLVSFWTGIPAS